MLGDFFDALDGSTVNIESGIVGRYFNALYGSTVNIDGGAIGDAFNARDGSTVNISGGTFGRGFSAKSNSTVNITGGNFGSFGANDATVNISGGTVGDSFNSQPSATVGFAGVDFAIDGVPLTGLDNVGDQLSLNLAQGHLLTGTFTDGTPFAFTSAESDYIANDSLTLIRSAEPAPGPAFIDVPGDAAPWGVHAGQTLNVSDGGTVGDNFNAGNGSVVVISGGTVGENLEAVGAEVNISGGVVGAEFDAFYDSTVNISGGNVGYHFQARKDSTVNLRGGSVGDHFEIAGATLNVLGTDFLINGAPIAGMDNVGDTLPVNLGLGQLLSGTLADGTPFAFMPEDGDLTGFNAMTLIRSVEPAPGPAVIDVPGAPALGCTRRPDVERFRRRDGWRQLQRGPW